MNFKPNAWTLLFALALGAFLYQMNMKKDVPTDSVKITENSKNGMKEICPPLILPPSDFYVDYGQYLSYASFLKNLFENGAKDCPSLANEFDEYASLVNPDVWSFHLPRCELDSMLRVNPDGDYYAYMIMKKPTKDSMVIDLAFSHLNVPGNPQFATMDKTLAAKGDGDGDGFFDFTSPCPPTCRGGD